MASVLIMILCPLVRGELEKQNSGGMGNMRLAFLLSKKTKAFRATRIKPAGLWTSCSGRNCSVAPIWSNSNLTKKYVFRWEVQEKEASEFHFSRCAERSLFVEPWLYLSAIVWAQGFWISGFLLTVRTRSDDDLIEKQRKPVQRVMCPPLRKISFYYEASIRPQSGPCSPAWLSQMWFLMSGFSSPSLQFSKWRRAYYPGRPGTSWRLRQFSPISLWLSH